jgi:hypothetical protein
MKEDLSTISPIIYLAIEILQKQFGGTDIKLVSKEMYRLEPSEHAPAGALGVNIQLEGITAFLGCESMAEQICNYGDAVAQEFIIGVYRTYNNQVNEE